MVQRLDTFFYEVDLKHRLESVREILLGGYGEGGTPEPIPNSEVKPFIADGTAHKSVGD